MGTLLEKEYIIEHKREMLNSSQKSLYTQGGYNDRYTNKVQYLFWIREERARYEILSKSSFIVQSLHNGTSKSIM